MTTLAYIEKKISEGPAYVEFEDLMSFIRYALFECNQFSKNTALGSSGHRYYTSQTLIADYLDIRVSQHTGEQFSRLTYEVYAELIRLALNQERKPKEIIKVSFKLDDLLKRLKSKPTVSNRERVLGELNRLQRATFSFDTDVSFYCFSLIDYLQFQTDDVGRPVGNFIVELSSVAEAFLQGIKNSGSQDALTLPLERPQPSTEAMPSPL